MRVPGIENREIFSGDLFSVRWNSLRILFQLDLSVSSYGFPDSHTHSLGDVTICKRKCQLEKWEILNWNVSSPFLQFKITCFLILVTRLLGNIQRTVKLTTSTPFNTTPIIFLVGDKHYRPLEINASSPECWSYHNHVRYNGNKS